MPVKQLTFAVRSCACCGGCLWPLFRDNVLPARFRLTITGNAAKRLTSGPPSVPPLFPPEAFYSPDEYFEVEPAAQVVDFHGTGSLSSGSPCAYQGSGGTDYFSARCGFWYPVYIYHPELIPPAYVLEWVDDSVPRSVRHAAGFDLVDFGDTDEHAKVYIQGQVNHVGFLNLYQQTQFGMYVTPIGSSSRPPPGPEREHGYFADKPLDLDTPYTINIVPPDGETNVDGHTTYGGPCGLTPGTLTLEFLST